jgi:molybdate transport system substrate-binding protein
MTRIVLAAAATALAILHAAPAGAAEVKFLCTNALKTVMNEVGPQFEKASGHKLSIVYGSTGVLKGRIDKGEAFDVASMGGGTLDDLIKQGKLAAASRAVIARSAMGVAIRKGAPKPDLASTEGFKRAMLNAKGIAFSEEGVTGVYLKDLFQRLGIAEALKPKLVNGRAAETVAEGKADIGVTQISEILPIAGAELAGPLPPEVQKVTAFPAAIGNAAKEADAAKALLKFLASPEALKVIKAKGLEPPA